MQCLLIQRNAYVLRRFKINRNQCRQIDLIYAPFCIYNDIVQIDITQRLAGQITMNQIEIVRGNQEHTHQYNTKNQVRRYGGSGLSIEGQKKDMKSLRLKRESEANTIKKIQDTRKQEKKLRKTSVRYFSRMWQKT